ncbi:disulfide bond formation protein B [Komagataeibacter rhaeticus]|uniref:Disulfide bond formation protein B n=2 Tax=Komagataeibacter rhaeticus TaxID=215221 RepID=A0A181C782_9PROT|nr:disulfide bond formation protein B [Komagataeibacter rhaeticus]ATU73721.1 disulfide bond formation protein B [Komagataeibacter xylinus]MBL7239850.1 disulfide bond formation protein B [Komagataeibacter rhaeticus]PYD55177.1 disulfide bond formation protein B [Komagataeibacter rhaeticus]QIP34377.1 disulfide bond formation protein B [Komagataeibacter rhaeticus]QOC46889.1 disulfide bond formation protein B [Komagataeibacter rhaeticus]
MRQTALLMVLAGCAALGVAWWSEHILGHVPCGLCLWERWPYRILVGFGLLGMVLPRDVARGAVVMCVPVLLVAAGLGFMHVGVEQGWWPSPLPECRAPTFHGGSFAQRLASMPARPAKPCDAPTYLLPGVPLSMAALGSLYALGLIPFVRRGTQVRTRFRGRGRKSIQG